MAMPSAPTIVATALQVILVLQPAVGGNPLVPNVGMADPHPHVYNDTLVLYAGHDAGGPNSTTWDMPDWRIWTSDNLIDWQLERVLRPDQGPLAAWNISECFATDGAQRCATSDGDVSSSRGGGGRHNTAGANRSRGNLCWYYFYFSNHSTDIGVLRSRNPTGPWEDPLKAPLFPAGTTDKTQYDPTVLTDKDGFTYLVWGRTNKSLPLSPGCAADPHCRRAGQASYHIARLTEDMIHLAEPPRLIVFGGAMPHADKPTLHRHGDRYYISAGDEYSIASDVYGPYTYAGKTGGGGGHGRFFQWRQQWFRAYVVQIHPPWIQPTVPYWRESWMTYVHYRSNGSMVDDTGFLATDNTTRLGVGQYSAAWPRIQAEWFTSGDGLRKQETVDGGFAVQLKVDGHLAFPNVQGIPRSGATLALSLCPSDDFEEGGEAIKNEKESERNLQHHGVGHTRGYAVRRGALDGPIVANCSVATGVTVVSCPLEMNSDGGPRGYDLFLVPLVQPSTRPFAQAHGEPVPAVDWFQIHNAYQARRLKMDETETEIGAGGLVPTRLRIEYQRTPLLGLDVLSPRFSWALFSTSRGLAQAAYELQISSDSSSWSSGKVSSNRSQNVVYSGPPLPADTDFKFNVTVWPTSGSSASTQSTFSTGISNADWAAARWLELNSTGNRWPYRGFQVRKEMHFTQGVRRVVAYVIGLGYYKLDVSGSRVSTHELGPFTTFSKRVLYDTYDLTAVAQTAIALHRPMVLAATVAPGWFTLLGAGSPRFRCKLSITYTNGSTRAVVSGDDSSWRVSPSPLLKAHLYDGEIWDARLEQPDWNAASGFTEAPGVWSAPSLIRAPAVDKIQYSSHAVLPPIRATQDFAPCDMWQLKEEPSVWIFDFCQNMAGITTLHLREGIHSSVNITQTFSESTLAAKPAGINRGMQQYAKETNVYITRGDGNAAVYRTGYVYAGFRFVEVRGLPYTPDESTIEAHFVHTDLEPVGAISFSDPLLVSIQRAARASVMSNFMHVPTDCPQRERRGWLGDAQLAASAVTHMFDTGSAYTTFVQQIRDAQNRATGEVQDCVPWYGHGFEPADPAWGAAFTLLPELIGALYDDDEIFVRHYAGITAHLESLISMAAGALLPGGPNDSHPGKHDLDGLLLAFGPYGDWCPAQGCVECQDPRKDPTAYNSALVASFYYISELRIVARYAATLSKTADAVRYGNMVSNASKAFMRHFYDTENKTFRETNRACTQYLSPQTSISLAHELGLLPSADTAQVTQQLVDSVAAAGWHVDTGIIGVKHLLPALSDLGRTDVALTVMQTRSAPSYGHMIEQGATTLWEQWGYAESPSGPVYLSPNTGASLNHVMFASCSAWFFQYLAGMKMAEGSRGWQRIELFPRVWIAKINQSICANLSAVSASIMTPRGLLKSEWNCNASWAPPPPPPHCPPLSPRFRFVGTNDTMCIHTKNRANCGVFFEDTLLHSKHHVVSCAMCDLTPCTSVVHVDVSHIAGLRTGLPFNCSMCGAPCAPPAPLPILFFYAVEVPTGSIATIVLPTMGRLSPTIKEGNRTVWHRGQFVGGGIAGVRSAIANAQSGTVSVEVGGGSYAWRVLRDVSESPHSLATNVPLNTAKDQMWRRLKTTDTTGGTLANKLAKATVRTIAWLGLGQQW